MLFADIDLLDENLDFRSHCWVGVRDGRVAYVGDAAPAGEEAARYGEVYDGRGKLLCPAFYNAHAHAPMTLLRGYAENLPLQAWLNDMVFPFEAKITPEDCYWGTLLSCAEMARYGCVSFSDMYYHMEEGARAALDAGIKMNLSDSLLAFNGEGLDDLPVKGNLDRLIRDVQGAGDGRIVVDCNIHAEYTSNPRAVADLAAYAKEHGLRLQVHVSETRLEHEECKQRHDGLTLARGVNVCLGTDGMASNNNHDMMQDMYLLALTAKGSTNDPAVVTPKQALTAATRMGALSQGRDDCGYVAVGAKADLCVLDTSGPSWAPMTNPLVNVVYAGHGADVCLTMCDGVVVYREGEWPTLDIERAKAEVEARTKRIIGEL